MRKSASTLQLTGARSVPDSDGGQAPPHAHKEASTWPGNVRRPGSMRFASCHCRAISIDKRWRNLAKADHQRNSDLEFAPWCRPRGLDDVAQVGVAGAADTSGEVGPKDPSEKPAYQPGCTLTRPFVTVARESRWAKRGVLPRMGQVMAVRAIEYEVVPRDMADGLGLSPAEVKVHFGDLKDLAVVKCVDGYGQKLTAVGDPQDLREMLTSKREGRSDDLELARSRWPVLLRGWLQAN